MKNPRKRPLSSMGSIKPNKYSIGGIGGGSKKRALNARPPKKASVARLESILDGAAKKTKQKIVKSKPKASNDNNRISSHKYDSTTTGTGSRRRVSDEHTRKDGHDRWSHVHSKTKSKHRSNNIVNPFLEAKNKPRTQNVNAKTTTIANSKPCTSVPLSKARIQSKEFRTKESKKMDRGATLKPILAATITPKKAISSPATVDRTNQDKSSDDSTNFMTLDNHRKTDHPSSKNSCAFSTQEETNPKRVRNEPTISNEEIIIPTKNPSIQKTTPPTDSQSPFLESKDPVTTTLDSSFRPKLGLSLGGNKKNTKKRPALALGSRFTSSRRVSSSPTDFAKAPPLAGAENENKNEFPDDDALGMVLGSPGKANAPLPFPQQQPPSLNPPKDFSGTKNSNKKANSIRKKNINDNFVRLNMKNKAGACRGAKNKSTKYSKERRSWSFRGAANDAGGSSSNPTHALTFDDPLPPSSYSKHDNIENTESVADETRDRRYNQSKSSKCNATSYVSKMSGLDPLDEFVDGTFHSRQQNSGKAGSKKAGTSVATTTTAATNVFGGIIAAEAPKCARHQRPCKLVKVKKATTGNKGREFYVCCMPRGEQCDHFQWADDTVEAARNILSKNSSYSSFITRQVASYVDRFKTLTVPELKEETARRGLNKNGKKQQLLMRLAIWTRDELVKSSPQLANEELEDEEDANDDKVGSCSFVKSDCDEESDDDSSSSSSEDELELFDGEEESEDDDDVDMDFEKMNGENVNTSRNMDDESDLSASLREIFGHTSFRDGQEWAIQRCLDEKSSLLVAPTGFGKSLCYALPAALMDGVCIVVSPLISLIQDQLRSLPPRVPAATLSGSVSASKTAAILDDIVRKRLKILFVSPERLTSPAFRRLFNLRWNPETNTKERKFPEISLLCIDEAHCISQWAHNFRPCFLRFKGFLQIMKPKSVLAITATAGPRVIRDIGETLGMDFPESITEEAPNTATDSEHESIKIIRSGRDNIDVMGKFMANQEERLAVVAGILTPAGTNDNGKKNPYAGKLARGSVIVYVWRQKDTEVVAESLSAAGVAGGVVVYHGGMDASARAKSQNKFMRGKARICVATVAFGLGIDKADIVGIVHLYLSNSPEHYLQEIGRAGRDGRSATAIALPLLEEVPTRHSLAFSNLVAKSQISSLLRMIRRLVQSAGRVCNMDDSNCGRFLHVALPVQSTVRACDCKPETIETFLSLIERLGGDNPLLQIEGYNYDGASIAMKKRTLKKLAEREPVAVSIQAVSQCVDAPLLEAGGTTEKFNTSALPSSFQRHFVAYSKGSHSFSISDCANSLGPTAEPRHVFAALRRLQSSNELEFVLDTSETGRIFQLKISEMGFQLFNGEEFGTIEENLVDSIFESFSSSSDSGATKFLDMHYILDRVAHDSEFSTESDASEEDISSSGKSPSLIRFQELTRKYFGEGLESERLAVEGLLPKSFSTIREKELKIDGLSLLRDLPPLFQPNSGNNSLPGKDLPPEHLKLGDASRMDYTALAITKFLHGMDTPRTPFLTFRQYPLFGKWKTVDFRLVHDSIRNVLESRG